MWFENHLRTLHVYVRLHFVIPLRRYIIAIKHFVYNDY